MREWLRQEDPARGLERMTREVVARICEPHTHHIVSEDEESEPEYLHWQEQQDHDDDGHDSTEKNVQQMQQLPLWIHYLLTQVIS